MSVAFNPENGMYYNTETGFQSSDAADPGLSAGTLQEAQTSQATSQGTSSSAPTAVSVATPSAAAAPPSGGFMGAPTPQANALATNPPHLNLSDPNQLALTGIGASQTTTLPYNQFPQLYSAPDTAGHGPGTAINQVIGDQQQRAFNPGQYQQQHPETQFNYQPINNFADMELGYNHIGQRSWNSLQPQNFQFSSSNPNIPGISIIPPQALATAGNFAQGQTQTVAPPQGAAPAQGQGSPALQQLPAQHYQTPHGFADGGSVDPLKDSNIVGSLTNFDPAAEAPGLVSVTPPTPAPTNLGVDKPDSPDPTNFPSYTQDPTNPLRPEPDYASLGVDKATLSGPTNPAPPDSGTGTGGAPAPPSYDIPGVSYAAPGIVPQTQPTSAEGYSPAQSYAAQGQVAPGSQYGAYQGQAAQGQVAPGSQYKATQAGAAQGQVAPGSQYNANLATAAQGQVDPMSMIQNQFDSIMSSNLGPDGVPAWAKTAVTAARQQMTAMGLGASTMAGGATAAAILNVALPMAQFNAGVVANLTAQNLNNIQQTNLANANALNAAGQYNASVVADLNKLNVQNAQQSILANAQWANTANQYNAGVVSNLNLANLSNAQQMEVANLQYANVAAQYNAGVVSQLNMQNLMNQQQTYLSNAAMQNSALQFNAQSQQQNNQFFSSLISQINSQNADRVTAINQFNSGQYNSMNQFVANLNNQRQEFDTQNQLLVDQSNVQWRRAINTANTAGTNAANQANVQNLFNLSQSAQNQLWQTAQDEASFSLTSSENSQNRLLSLVNSALNRQTSLQILGSQLNANMFSQLGGFAANLLGGSLGTSAINSIFGGGSSSGGDFSDSALNIEGINSFGGGSDLGSIFG